MPQNSPDARLMTAVCFIHGNTVADIGTDHAYLPIYLVSEGYVQKAVAADINEGPISRAKANIGLAGLSDRIDAVRTDGLHGIEKYEPDDIIIFGMGGELIAKIIDEAPWVRNGGIRLIMQPMTHADDLRRYLAENGFDIIGEMLSDDGGKIYQTVCAEYRPECVGTDMPDLPELMFGKINIQRGGELFERLLLNTQRTYLRRRKGKQISGADTSEEDGILCWILQRLKGNEQNDCQ